MTTLTTDVSAHHDRCWRSHDPCALRHATVLLAEIQAREPTARTRDRLALVRMAAMDHTPEAPCPDGATCIAVRMARDVLAAL